MYSESTAQRAWLRKAKAKKEYQVIKKRFVSARLPCPDMPHRAYLLEQMGEVEPPVPIELPEAVVIDDHTEDQAMGEQQVVII